MNPLKKSAELFERSKKVSPGGVHSPVRGFRGVGGVPPFIARAEGSRLFDVDGNSYVDFCMSWGPLIFGHQEPEIASAVREAMGRGWTYGTAEPYSLELAELITSKLPWIEKIRFVNSGTEAVMSALRVARGATGRHKILKFDGCYHGHVDSMLVRAGSGLAEMANPDSAGVSEATAAETIVAPLNDIAAVEKIFSLHGKEIAAVIIEPLPANNGLLIQEESFLKRLAEIARKHGSLLIFDEVISGFRVAFGGMAELTGIRPDLVTFGKVIGGGFPVGAYGGRRELLDLVAPAGPVYQAGTLSANPVAMAAGLATLKKLARENPFPSLKEKTARLIAEMSEASRGFSRFKIHGQSFGSLFWCVLGQDEHATVRSIDRIPARQKELFARVFHLLLQRGYYLAPSGFEVGFLSTAHSPSELSGLVGAFRECLEVLERE